MSKIPIPSVPHLLHIEVTYACNQRCLFCYNPSRDKQIDSTVVDRIVDSVYRSWVPHVYLIGGEPSCIGVERLNGYIEQLSERSSVTIVTNCQIYLEGLSTKLACIGIPLHGARETHNYLTNNPHSYDRAIETARNYVADGFDTRCIPVLTRQNYDQMYDLIGLAKEIGMESVFVDRFEDGGLGSQHSDEMKPSLAQFRIALGQMIQARDDFEIPVGWGTAIPFCLDPRLVSANMSADCGAGVTFCAVTPNGEVRVCNQSLRVYGNLLDTPIEEIWHSPELDDFRDLGWIESPCTACSSLFDCLCGCKVDANYCDRFSVDYAVRGQAVDYPIGHNFGRVDPPVQTPLQYRRFVVNRYAKLNTFHAEHYLVTRYQTVEVNSEAEGLIAELLCDQGVVEEREFVSIHVSRFEESDLRTLLSRLILVGAIDEVK